MSAFFSMYFSFSFFNFYQRYVNYIYFSWIPEFFVPYFLIFLEVFFHFCCLLQVFASTGITFISLVTKWIISTYILCFSAYVNVLSFQITDVSSLTMTRSLMITNRQLLTAFWKSIPTWIKRQPCRRRTARRRLLRHIFHLLPSEVPSIYSKVR